MNHCSFLRCLTCLILVIGPVDCVLESFPPYLELLVRHKPTQMMDIVQIVTKKPNRTEELQCCKFLKGRVQCYARVYFE